MARRYEEMPRLVAKDPRRPGTRPHTSKRKARKVLERVEYKYDKYSVGPAPPREIVISGMSPRTSPQVVLQQCRSFGSIESSELKVDPQTGESIGILWVQFANATPTGSAQDGAEIAIKAQKSLHGQKIGQETVTVVLDRERAKYVRTYRELLSKRYSGSRRRSNTLLPQQGSRSSHSPGSPYTPTPRAPARRWGRADEDEAADSPHRATTSRAVYASARPQNERKAYSTATHIRERLASLGHPYIFLPLARSTLDVGAIRAHFASFSPELIESDHAGWYIGFREADTAARCKRVLEPTTLQGYRVRLDVLPPPEGDAPTPKPAPAPAAPPAKTSWTPEELVEEAEKQLMSALQSMFLRDVKNRTLAPLLSQFLGPEGAGEKYLAQQKTRTAEKPTTAPPVLDTHMPSFRKRPEVVAAQHVPKPKRRLPSEALDYSGDEDEEASEATTPLNPIALGVVQDAEELYYLQKVLTLDASGTPIPDDTDGPHESGCARAEGFYRIPGAEKAAHLPDRNRAVEAPMSHRPSLVSARNNRADSRRLALDIEQHKRETMTDTDILKFNQLQTRKKQLRFSKSPIHDWGLYAMELIPAGDMVIEYVGEIVRQQVADHREKMYERAGNFSTYLFRVDDDVVVDATHKGNIARLMNVRRFLLTQHCCTPNCTAKILTLQGEKRIALLYVSRSRSAKTTILPGQELTYDYKCTPPTNPQSNPLKTKKTPSAAFAVRHSAVDSCKRCLCTLSVTLEHKRGLLCPCLQDQVVGIKRVVVVLGHRRVAVDPCAKVHLLPLGNQVFRHPCLLGVQRIEPLC